jgi:hypothetical protein
MSYGLTMGFEFFQCLVTCSFQWIHEGWKIYSGSNHEICGKQKDVVNLDIHEGKIAK